ncbi:MAG: DUF3426 domain-containing protein [Rhizobiales bacterium]|nr:DUF3426 domain-containing protein [Hyphomicrobiales bacterium]
MLIECPSCSVQYEVESADALVGRKVRCTECAHVWKPIPFAPGETPPTAPVAPKNQAPASASGDDAGARAGTDDRPATATSGEPEPRQPTDTSARGKGEYPGEDAGQEASAPAGADAVGRNEAPSNVDATRQVQDAPSPVVTTSAPPAPPAPVSPKAAPSPEAGVTATVAPAVGAPSVEPSQLTGEAAGSDRTPPAPPSPPAPRAAAAIDEAPPAPARKSPPQPAPDQPRLALRESEGQPAAAPPPAPRAASAQPAAGPPPSGETPAPAAPVGPVAAVRHGPDEGRASPPRPGPRPAPPRPSLAGPESREDHDEDFSDEPDDRTGDDWPEPDAGEAPVAPRFERPRGPRLAERAANARAVQARANGFPVHHEDDDPDLEEHDDDRPRSGRSDAGLSPSDIVPARLTDQHARAAPSARTGRAARWHEPIEPGEPSLDDIDGRPSARAPAGPHADVGDGNRRYEGEYPSDPELEGPPFGGDFEVDEDFGANARILGKTGRSVSRRSPLALIALTLGWLLLLAVAGGAGTVIALYPDEVSERFPGMRKFYAAVGQLALPAEELRIGALKVNWHRAVNTGVAVVQGRLVNVTEAPIVSPTLEFLVRDESGNQVSSWTQRLENLTIPAGKGVPFAMRIPVPPGIARSVDVRLSPAG